MNSRSNAVSGTTVESRAVAPAMMAATRPFYWSVRRELWENRSIYVAPLVVAGLFLFGFLIRLARLPGKMRGAANGPMQLHELVAQPYNFLALLIMGTTFVVGLFYCLDALQGERRDRSILFWKSLPVSDLTTVLSKASIPVVVIPVVSFVITLATQWIMLMMSSIVLAVSGVSVAGLWQHVPLFSMSVMLLFHLVAIHGLWYAPFYGWLLLVSAWARRAVFLWAALPLVAIGVVERIAFNSGYFAGILQDRFMGSDKGTAYGPSSMSMDPWSHMSVGAFLTSTGLWVGLAVFALFLFGAVRLRRSQGPV